MKTKHINTEHFVTEELENKLLVRNLILDMKMPQMDFIDRAKMLERALELEKKSGTKKPYAVLAKKIGLSGHKEIYRPMAVLTANENTKRLMQDGKIAPEKVARVLYNLKDRSKEDEVIAKVIRHDVPILKAEKLVSETNNPKLIVKHPVHELEQFKATIDGYASKLKSVTVEDKFKTLCAVRSAQVIDALTKLRDEFL